MRISSFRSIYILGFVLALFVSMAGLTGTQETYFEITPNLATEEVAPAVTIPVAKDIKGVKVLDTRDPDLFLGGRMTAILFQLYREMDKPVGYPGYFVYYLVPEGPEAERIRTQCGCSGWTNYETAVVVVLDTKGTIWYHTFLHELVHVLQYTHGSSGVVPIDEWEAEAVSRMTLQFILRGTQKIQRYFGS